MLLIARYYTATTWRKNYLHIALELILLHDRKAFRLFVCKILALTLRFIAKLIVPCL